MNLARISFLPALVISLAVISGCQSVNTGEQQDAVSTRGTAELMVMPDQAEIIFGIEQRSQRLEDAREQAETSVQGLLELTSKLGIPAGQVDSTGIIARPEYRYDDGERNFVGYFVSRQVRVTVKELDLLGPLTDGAFKAGINTVAPPALGVSNPRGHYRKALELAAADARANAETLATSLDARLGRVLSIDEAGNNTGPVDDGRVYMMKAEAAPETAMQAGQIRFAATVNARFALVN